MRLQLLEFQRTACEGRIDSCDAQTGQMAAMKVTNASIKITARIVGTSKEAYAIEYASPLAPMARTKVKSIAMSAAWWSVQLIFGYQLPELTQMTK